MKPSYRITKLVDEFSYGYSSPLMYFNAIVKYLDEEWEKGCKEKKLKEKLCKCKELPLDFNQPLCPICGKKVFIDGEALDRMIENRSME